MSIMSLWRICSILSFKKINIAMIIGIRTGRLHSSWLLWEMHEESEGLGPFLASCVTLDKSYNLSELQCPPINSGDRSPGIVRMK